MLHLYQYEIMYNHTTHIIYVFDVEIGCIYDDCILWLLMCQSSPICDADLILWGMGVEVQLQGLHWGYRLNYEPWARYLGQSVFFLGRMFW